ncbi:MAG: hypothetical protein HYX46_02260 [Betaproteobacteria bacterium]|jgi:hypothetical protein|nr:hypothetical protein [Betaproteobacteria bacterium]
MAIDPSTFHLVNVADTCSVWNVLSSARLHAAAKEARCEFCITSFVRYECLTKSRKAPSSAGTTLHLSFAPGARQPRRKRRTGRDASSWKATTSSGDQSISSRGPTASHMRLQRGSLPNCSQIVPRQRQKD